MSDLIKNAESFVRTHVAMHFPPVYRYHNVEHMAEVAAAAKELAKQADLPKDQATALRVAAWFHDTAYYQGAIGHEERSAELAARFLADEGAEAALIDRVRELIRATELNRPAADPLQEMIKDADLAHCAKPDYSDRMENLRKEIEEVEGRKVKKKVWLLESVAFLENTPFLSASAKALWTGARDQNLAALRRAAEDRESQKESESKEDADKLAEKEAMKKRKETERGVETMFKVTLGNHTRLSAIADRKASMMLSVSSLIISVVISRLITNLEGHDNMLIPSGLLTLTCAATIITATLATRPKVTQGRTSRKDIEDKKANLLFFGNFHDMSYADFSWGMQEVMNDREYLYGSLTKDLYFLGKVLHKKYFYLNLTYNIFAIGLLLAIASGVYAAIAVAPSVAAP